MLAAYTTKDGALVPLEPPGDLAKALWIDLVQPSQEEESRVEKELGVEVPTREEMREIEPSSRLYLEGTTRFMTAVLLCGVEKGVPSLAAVTFVLHDKTLITVRYDDPKPFALFCARAAKSGSIGNATAESVLVGLMDTIVDRVADILERIGDDLDTASRNVFAPAGDNRSRFYKDDLRHLGRKADLISKTRECLVSLSRLLLFWSAESDPTHMSKELKADVRTMQRDVDSLALHADYLNSKAQLLLDAIVGMVSIEQNNIIKIFAVLSVVLMPPTLVASVYGMNFENMPELHWRFGYPFALALMLVTGALPYLFFKWKRWL
jgi:magnesium transporter